MAPKSAFENLSVWLLIRTFKHGYPMPYFTTNKDGSWKAELEFKDEAGLIAIGRSSKALAHAIAVYIVDSLLKAEVRLESMVEKIELEAEDVPQQYQEKYGQVLFEVYCKPIVEVVERVLEIERTVEPAIGALLYQ